jgi:hypothetical protein
VTPRRHGLRVKERSVVLSKLPLVAIIDYDSFDEGARQAWTKELERHRSKTLGAPNWLWSSVVELIGRQEVAYL